MSHYLLLLLLVVCTLAQDEPSTPTKFNVLVLNVDDLRPSLGCYGLTQVQSPNIDNLANRGVLFKNAFVQESICSPSRASFLTSRRPDSLKIWNFINHIRQTSTPNYANLTTLPGYFKNQGYYTFGAGKSFHDNLPPSYDGARSWSPEFEYIPTDKSLCNESDSLIWSTVPKQLVNPEALCPLDKPDSYFFEHKVADHIIDSMNFSIQEGKPFLAWAGFFKPHHPFIIPKRFYDMYTVDDIKLPANKILDVPLDFQDAALFNYNQGPQAHGPFTNGTDTYDYGPHTPLPDEWIRMMRAGYYASISWTDSQIGRVLDSLSELGVLNTTVVVLFSDNGISMGENSAFMKTDNWDISTRVPLIFSGPGVPNGKIRSTVVELLDIYPTLASLAGLAVPADLEGKNLKQVVRANNEMQYEDYVAFSQTPRCGNLTSPEPWRVLTPLYQWNCMGTPRPSFTHMGYTLRSKYWRYTEWRKWKPAVLDGDWTEAGLVGCELYDHRGNPAFGEALFDNYETENVCADYSGSRILSRLVELLHSNFNA